MTLSDISTLAKAAVILGLAGFVVRIESSYSSSTNGVITHCDYTDYGALALGGAALAVGSVALVQSLVRRNGPSIGIAVAGVVLGLYHVAAGSGMIGNPCG